MHSNKESKRITLLSARRKRKLEGKASRMLAMENNMITRSAFVRRTTIYAPMTQESIDILEEKEDYFNVEDI